MNIGIKITGLENLHEQFGKAPDILEREIGVALGHSVAMVETESKRRTPVRTGLLRSSIGGEQGFSFVRGLTAGVGTNVVYAIYVHESTRSKHNVGEAKFMEKGAQASESFIQKEFNSALKRLAEELAK